jgi:hypothetical protein
MISQELLMQPSPFISDPRELFSHHVALAIEAQTEELAAIHIRQAEHHAEIAKASALPIAPLKP